MTSRTVSFTFERSEDGDGGDVVVENHGDHDPFAGAIGLDQDHVQLGLHRNVVLQLKS